MKTIRVLTIGNSFAENALRYLEAMIEQSCTLKIQVGRANLGGCSLEKHWNLATYTAQHAEYKPYRIETAKGEATLQEALALSRWDVVTLQQVSAKSWRTETFQPYLTRLYELVKALAPQARVLLHQTWAYRTDSPFFPQNGLTQDLMHNRIMSTYAHYAAELQCDILRSGEAVQLARGAKDRHFSWPDPCYDYLASEAPTLPCQDHSLAVGWHWLINATYNGIPELRLDANHLNAAGCYLVGCVWFEMLTGRDARSIRFCPTCISDDTAGFLRNTAHAVSAT